MLILKRSFIIFIGILIGAALFGQGLSVSPTQADSFQQDNRNIAITQDAITRVRQGPSLIYPLAYEIPPQQQVTALGSSTDQSWVLIVYRDQYGWAPYDALRELPLLQPLQTPPVNETVPYQRCVSLVGDSVPYGDVVFLVPGHGFPVVRTEPMSLVLSRHLAARGLGYLEVRDRSVAAAYLSDQVLQTRPDRKVYLQQPEYNMLLVDNCQFIVVMPWVNDMTIVRDNPYDTHVDILANFLQTLRTNNPHSHIVVLGYYYVQANNFVENFDTGWVLPERIAQYNNAIFTACQPFGRIGSLYNVTCLRTETLFENVNGAYTAQNFTQAEFYAILEGNTPPPESAGMFDVYWRENPEGLVTGDGVHLSPLGKAVIVDAVIEALVWINPDL